MPVLDREEFIEQAYFFHAFRERLADGVPSQEILARIGEELLSTTKLPMAIGFIATESKVTGLMAPAMRQLSHYFTPFQSHVVSQAESDISRFPMEQALLILEREVEYKAKGASLPGLFIYQFESIARNRLGYTKGLAAMAEDPVYDEDWRDYIMALLTRLGDVDFADLIFVRSAFFVNERRKLKPDFVPKYPSLFGEKEGKIARANRGRDPLYLFSALQRQLGYPEVPRPRRPDGVEDRIALLEQRVAQLESRLKFVESEGSAAATPDLDLKQVIVNPEDTAGVPAGWAPRRLGT
jgi:hypothetical protein